MLQHSRTVEIKPVVLSTDHDCMVDTSIRFSSVELTIVSKKQVKESVYTIQRYLNRLRKLCSNMYLHIIIIIITIIVFIVYWSTGQDTVKGKRRGQS